MQLSRCTKGLYKMNKNSIKGFLTNQEILLSLWPLHDNGSLSYIPISLLKPKQFWGVIKFEDHFFHDKIFDWTSFFSYQLCRLQRIPVEFMS